MPCWCAAAITTCRPQPLEALIKAVEQDEIPYKRVEQALAHQRAAKERFLLTLVFL